ncbi:MAG: MOSC domain-containing protein [Phycisphaerales bacterium]
MRVVSVNIAVPKTVEQRGKPTSTGIFKKPTANPVRLTATGVEGDYVADTKNHGGPEMAVYCIDRDVYERWESGAPLPASIGTPLHLSPGIFGENLTLEGMSDTMVHIGDRFAVGTEGAEIEVSMPRTPCSMLGIAMGDMEFPKRFLESNHVGFYARVIREGHVRAGDSIRQSRADAAHLSVAEVVRIRFFENDNAERIARALECRSLSPKWRTWLEQRREELAAGKAS